MALSYNDFISNFPEFSNDITYPPSQIDLWIKDAYSALNAVRFGSRLDLAAMLYVAHNVVLSARGANQGINGGIVGAVYAPVSSKSVGPASVSYDTSGYDFKNAGPWNSTAYGLRFYHMLRIAGAGGLYVPSTKPDGASLPW